MGSVEILEVNAGTRHEAEAVALVLMHAADYIYERGDNGNPDNYKAVDLLDGIREDLGFCGNNRKPSAANLTSVALEHERMATGHA